MKVTAIKTHIIKPNEDLLQVIANTIPVIPERSVVVVTSKVVSYWKGDLVMKDPAIVGDPVELKKVKHALVRQEAEWYLEPDLSRYNLMFTRKHQCLAVNAGIDESNADGCFMLWPKDPQGAVNEIWRFVRQHYGVKEVGVTLSDSKTYPMRWGVIGTCIASCGIKPLRSYIGVEDLFGYTMKMEQSNMAEAITVAAVLEMGEGAEQQPLAVVTEVSNLEFVEREPSETELAELVIDIEDDCFEPLLSAVEWKKGGH